MTQLMFIQPICLRHTSIDFIMITSMILYKVENEVENAS